MSSSRAWKQREREREREQGKQAARDLIADLQEYHPVPEPDTLGDDGYYATWYRNGTQVTVRGLNNLHLTLDARWVKDDERNGLYAPKDYASLEWLARDIVRVLEDRDAIYSLGRDYTTEEAHQERVAKVKEHQRKTQELLDRTG